MTNRYLETGGVVSLGRIGKRLRLLSAGVVGGAAALVGTAVAVPVSTDPDRVNVDGEMRINATGFFVDTGSSFTVDAEDDSWGFCPFSYCVVQPNGQSIIDGTVEPLSIGAIPAALGRKA